MYIHIDIDIIISYIWFVIDFSLFPEKKNV